jgi:hypothetical protein
MYGTDKPPELRDVATDYKVHTNPPTPFSTSLPPVLGVVISIQVLLKGYS